MAEMLCLRAADRRGATGRAAGMRGGAGGHSSEAVLSAVDGASAGVAGWSGAVGRLPAAVAAVSGGGDAAEGRELSSVVSTGRQLTASEVDAGATLAALVEMPASG